MLHVPVCSVFLRKPHHNWGRTMMATAGRQHQHPVRQLLPTPDVIEILEDEENERDTSVWLSDHGGEQSNPITVEDYTEDVLVQHAIAASIASSRHCVIDIDAPIIVEDYPEDALVQRAIAASIASSVRTVIDLDNVVDGDVEVVEDRKGKSIKQYSRKARRGSFAKPSVIEQGESSSVRSFHHPFPTCASSPSASIPLLPTTLCTICMEAKPLSEFSSMKGCTHLFCSDCISQYVAAKVQENVAAIKCPQPGCTDGSLEPEMCRPILPVEVFDRWCTALCEALFVGDVRFYCPFKDCSALLIDDVASGSGGGKGDAITHSECPHCHRLFCAQCKVPWHEGVECNVFQSLGVDERGREDIMLMEMAKKRKWQRCPKCKVYVERTEGCMFMLCRCGFRFCYGCAWPMLIDHYCAKCKR